MIYVALLRGINVGGKSKIEMSKLKKTFEGLDFKNVKTYINSGNVIFKTESENPTDITNKIESAIKKDFGFEVKVLLRDLNAMKSVVKALPLLWKNDKEMKCDVMFLWNEFDQRSIFKQIPFNKKIEDSKYIPGAILWRVDRLNQSKTRIIKHLMGSKLYREMTIRNCNTVRKLYELMMEVEK